ncbi:hypothetical protein [Pseudomarimonas arenosa]|uniref:Uncharacterized protein n=1 Tax=Pseudomarimonas arenosa TaxID=2774145 RepID=A0AAW3ZH08_9GAMM|nr:hypothetical protein [Pseudomarimonas arenosa]MBD8524412.1 hypothetical protein [Pseudomarimonas arenosa]
MNRNASSISTKSRSIRRVLIGLAMSGLIASFASTAAETPSMRHTHFMRGQVVEAQDQSLVICIGSADGASIGQQLDVVQHRRVRTGPKGMGRFEREVVGKVRIDAIVDEHYAEATVISGTAGKNDSVELAPPKE